MSQDYYVYVYIDPRNFEEFYYGKGRGKRKLWHLTDGGDSEKTRRISEISEAGLEPIVRVIARGLSEHDALLVEKTLLWKLGKTLTNVSSGHYKNKFRPHNTMHTPLSGFDFQHGLFYYNVGENYLRNWDDYRKYNFISAGAGPRYRDAITAFNRGDIVVAYLKGAGYVGIAKIMEAAVPYHEFVVRGKRLSSLKLNACMDHHGRDKDLCEYVARVRWIKKLKREAAKWESNTGLFTTPMVRASLDGQPDTIAYLEREFEVSFAKLLGN